jgi:probable rRNA maturation factor
MPARFELDLSYAAKRPWAPPRAELFRWVKAAVTGNGAAAHLRRHSSRLVLSVRIVGEARSRTLNARYRNKKKSTNVLSFGGAGALPNGENFLGELVICAPVVGREARAQGKSAEAHWAHMTVHGVLHLLGFDHEHRAEARKMEAREIQILDRLGFSNPYAWPEA